MPALTPTRKRLSLCEKQKIIEESKAAGFDRNKTAEAFGNGKSMLPKILLYQKDILGCIDKGSSSPKSKAIYKATQIEIEEKLYHCFVVTIKAEVMIDGPMLMAKAKEMLLQENRYAIHHPNHLNFSLVGLMVSRSVMTLD